MKVLVTGDRNWQDASLIYNALLKGCATSIVHGGARGADILSGNAAYALSITAKVYPAQWDKYGRAAGPIRNRKQFDDEQPDIVYAFHNDISASRGTRDMVEYALSQGCDVLLHSEHGDPILIEGHN